MMNLPAARPARWARERPFRALAVGLAGRLGAAWRGLRSRPGWHRLLAGAIALRGQRVGCRGLTISVANPTIGPREKAMLFHGRYERARLDLALRRLDPGLPTVELGGSIGLVACAFGRISRRPADHVVVEADPQLIPTLEENRRLNGGRFEVVAAAIGYGGPTVPFRLRAFPGAPGRGDRIAAPAVTLGRIVAERGFGPINLIVDLGGTEVDLVEHELEAIRRHVERLVLETHDRRLPPGATAAMIDRLESAGLRLAPGTSRRDPVLAFARDARPAS